MPRVRLTVSLPDDAWLGAVSRTYPTARFRVPSAVPGAESGGVGLLEVDAGSVLPDVVADVDAAAAVTELVVLGRDADRALLQFETTDATLLDIVRDAGVPLSFPFEVDDGAVHWEFRADQHRLAALADGLDAAGLSYTVDAVEQSTASPDVLTPAQRRLVRAAVDRGYYETPRGCELRDLATEFDMAVSTCSETLRRAEGAVLARYVERGQPEGSA
ncbi:helix-turn-helix domain-containing protein [Halorarius litoreus]|uniref:helix-turn-helix domain-containing protein n=1 Tax=Halorarius litoreus TaxID=2962676 RepID=UPI0020CE9F8D|nr:helix-turn-helix domain-containing protein [Halorarius litoreus]